MHSFSYYMNLSKASNQKKVTVSIIEDDGALARGVAVCNPKDQFNKKLGREISLGRAIKALNKQATCWNNEICNPYIMNLVPMVFISKCEYAPVLTSHEESILKRITESQAA